MYRIIFFCLFIILNVQLFCDLMLSDPNRNEYNGVKIIGELPYNDKIAEIKVDTLLYINANSKIIPCFYKIENADLILPQKVIQNKFNEKDGLDTLIFINNNQIFKCNKNSYSNVLVIDSTDNTTFNKQKMDSILINKKFKTVNWANESDNQTKKINGKLYFGDLLLNYHNLDSSLIDSALISLKLVINDQSEYILTSTDTTFYENTTKRSDKTVPGIPIYILKYWYIISLVGLSGIAVTLYFRKRKP